MTHHEDRFAAGDGLTLYEQSWLPLGEPRATVIVVHGVTEHGGRYARLANELNRRGYAVHAMDLRGHGRSDGDRILIREFDQYLDDLELFVGRVAERQAGKPLFLFGHSMGGAIVALLAATRQPDARGVILSAPAVLVAGGVFPVLRRLAGFVSLVWPTLRLVHMGCHFSPAIRPWSRPFETILWCSTAAFRLVPEPRFSVRPIACRPRPRAWRCRC